MAAGDESSFASIATKLVMLYAVSIVLQKEQLYYKWLIDFIT